jgi:hypothetical protein
MRSASSITRHAKLLYMKPCSRQEATRSGPDPPADLQAAGQVYNATAGHVGHPDLGVLQVVKQPAGRGDQQVDALEHPFCLSAPICAAHD